MSIRSRSYEFAARVSGKSAPTQNLDLRKDTEEFAQIAVAPAVGAKHEPASWVLDRDEFVKHYKNSVYIAVGAIARKVAMQTALVERVRIVNGEEQWEAVPYDHPLRALLREVNERDTTWDLWFYMIAWRLTCGNSFLWKARNGFGTPRELWMIPPQWVHALPDRSDFVGGYLVQGYFGADETIIEPQNMVHMREPNLDWSGNGRFYGWPQLAAAAEPVDLEIAMLKRLRHAFENYAPPGEKFYTDTELTKEQLRDVYRQIVSQHRSAEQFGRPMVTHGGLKPFGTHSVKELDYAKSLDTTMEKTLAIFGVPKAVVGIVTEVNRANMVGAMLAFCDNTVNPLLGHTGQHLTQGLALDFGPDLRIRFEKCTIDDAETHHKIVELMASKFALTPNEIREELSGRKPFEFGGSNPVGNDGIPLLFGNEEPPEPEPKPNVTPPTETDVEPVDDDDEIDKSLLEEMREDQRWIERITKALGADAEQFRRSNGHPKNGNGSPNGSSNGSTSHAGTPSTIVNQDRLSPMP